MKEINKGTRIANYLIDTSIISIIAGIIVAISSFNETIVFYSVFFVYYFILESNNGQTIGKRITKTVAVDMCNSQPSVLRVLYRSLLRLNPFDGYSYLFGKEQGGHDLLSKTRLKVKEHNN